MPSLIGTWGALVSGRRDSIPSSAAAGLVMIGVGSERDQLLGAEEAVVV